MRIYHFLFMLCCGLIVACSSADTIFPREEIIAQELMPLQGVTFPVRIEVKHPFLILQNIKRADSLYHIYDLTNYELKSSFGIIGQGPGEFVHPWLFHSQLSDILIGDKNTVYRVGINKEGLAVFKDTKQLSYNNNVYGAAFINDSLYVVDAMYTAPDLYLLALQDKLPRKSWTYRNPDIMDYYVDPDMGNVYANENRIAFCYGYKKQIDFMDTGFNLIKRVKFNYANPANTNSENQGDVKMSYVYGYLGKNYLYALFLGTSWDEHREKSFHGAFLEVFDLNGNPVAKYYLEGISPAYFAVDENTSTLYGKGVDGDPEDYLLVYKLKGLS